MDIAPEPILKAALTTLHWATVCSRNWTLRSEVPLKMVNDLMEAIHEVPSILMHYKQEHSLDEIILHLSGFDEEFWKQQVDNDIFSVPNLAAFFRDRLQEFSDNGRPSTPTSAE